MEPGSIEDGTSSNSGTYVKGSRKQIAPQSLKIALQEAAHHTRGTGESTPDSEEDYDKLRVDPLTIIRGGKGGGFDSGVPTADSDDEVVKVFEQLKTAPSSGVSRRPTNLKLKSIPLPGKKGQNYYVIADDAELKEILKTVIERVCPPLSHTIS